MHHVVYVLGNILSELFYLDKKHTFFALYIILLFLDYLKYLYLLFQSWSFQNHFSQFFCDEKFMISLNHFLFERSVFV